MTGLLETILGPLHWEMVNGLNRSGISTSPPKSRLIAAFFRLTASGALPIADGNW
jgi:hypothetical protein